MRRVFLWIYLVLVLAVAVGVFLQAFSIAAFARGAGSGARSMHETVGFITHSVEILVFLIALIAYWGEWRSVGLAFLLPVLGTLQIALIGDTEKSGDWVNGLHGMFALIVLLLALGLAARAIRVLRAPAASPG